MTSMKVGGGNSEPIPIDLIIEILLRLPAKSIARCRCVSKLWGSIFHRPYFTELFLTRSLTRPQVLFACHFEDQLLFFSVPQPQNLDVNSFLVAATQLTRFPLSRTYEMCSSFRGLVCYTHEQIIKGRKVNASVICNPSTGGFLNLPVVKTRPGRLNSFFGYDPIDKQLKVLSIVWSSYIRHGRLYEEYQALILGTGELSWRMIECNIPQYPSSNNICINGVVYYTALHRSLQTEIIVCFEVRMEKFSFIEVRKGVLTNYNGKLGLLTCEGSSYINGERMSFELWVLENLEKQEWSKHSYVLPALWKSIVGNAFLRFLGVTRTNEVVLSSECFAHPFYLLYFNLDRKTIVRVEIQGISTKYCGLYTSVDHVEDVNLLM